MPKYQGRGGAVFEINPPAEGNPARKYFTEQLAAGDLVLVDEPAKPKAAKPAADDAKE